MRRPRTILALSVLMASCGGREEGRPQVATPPPTPADAAPARPVVPEAREAPAPYVENPADARWLVVEAHTHTEARARHAAIELDDQASKATVVPLGAAPALVHRSWSGHFRAVSAHQGPRWIRAASTGTADAPRFRLVVADASAPKSAARTIDLGDLEPTALHLVGSTVHIGAGQRVGWIDLGAGTPAFTEVVSRQLRGGKAYDLFVRLGDRLLAVDDVVMPMLADWFALDSQGRARRLGDWSLPGVINGHYQHAALLTRGPGEWTLFLVAQYSIRSGSGHDLAAVPVRGDSLVFPDDLVLQNARGGPIPVLEEHVARGSQGIGKTITAWTGMAVDAAGGKLLIAAGGRGLLVVPTDFAHDTPVISVSLGDCRDVIASGGHLFALIGSRRASEVVVLVPAGGTYRVARRHALGASFDRFVD